MSESGKAVFLSYAHEDADAARRIADALRAFGVEVWFDMSELRGGDTWDVKIRRQIRECALFIPIISANTQARGEGYFRREWKLAVDRTHDMSENRAYLVPVITDSTPEAEADVPEQFMKAQFTRLMSGMPTSQFVDQVKRLLQSPQAASSRAAPAVSASARRRAGDAPDPKSIAVLPFADMSQARDQEYFTDGLSEELLHLLTKIPALQVTSRSSAFSFKGQNIGITEVARRLNVAHILEGSVRKAGNRLRITTQLIDARTDRHLWSETYDRSLDDVFAVQDEIAAAVVGQLKVSLLGAAPKTKSFDPRAYALFLQARQLSRQGSAANLEDAIRLFQEAHALDPNLAAACDGLALCYMDQSDGGLRSNAEGYQLARKAIDQALAIDPDLATVHARLGYFHRSMGELANAAAEYERALVLEPANTDIIGEATYVLRSLGRLDEAVSFLEFVVAHDPVNAAGYGRLGGAYLRVNRFEEGVAALKTALSLSPGRSQSHYSVGEAELARGNLDVALAEMKLEASEAWRLMGLPMVYHALGLKDKSDAALAELIAKYERDAPWNIAYNFALRGEVDRAFEWLEKAIEHKDPGLGDTAVQWQFKSMYGDPRWLPFLRKIGRAPEQLAAIKFDVMLPR